MTPTNTKKKLSLLSIALGSLIATSLGTGIAEALPFNCSLQCSKSRVAKDEKRLNECASKCDNTKIMDILLPNAAKLNEANQKHFEGTLKYQQSIKEREHTNIETQLKAETTKPKQSKSKINDLNKKQDKLMNEINVLKDQLRQIASSRSTKLPPEDASKSSVNLKSESLPPRPTSKTPSTGVPSRPKGGTHLSQGEEKKLKNPFDTSWPSSEEAKAPERSKSKPSLSRSTSKRASDEETKTLEHSTNRAHLNNMPPPSHLPPPLPAHLADPTKGTGEEAPVHKAPSKGPDEKPEPEMKKTGGPVPPMPGQNPRAILKAELQAQNPGKKPFEIDAMLKQKLETEHAGKSAAEINQALKADQDARYGGKNHAEILESLKAASPQTSSGNSTTAPSKTTGAPSPQATQKASSEAKPQGNIMEALSGLGDNPQARLRKVDPNAPRTGKGQQQAQPEKNLKQHLEEAMTKRNLDMNPDKKVNPDLDFEQDFDD